MKTFTAIFCALVALVAATAFAAASPSDRGVQHRSPSGSVVIEQDRPLPAVHLPDPATHAKKAPLAKKKATKAQTRPAQTWTCDEQAMGRGGYATSEGTFAVPGVSASVRICSWH